MIYSNFIDDKPIFKLVLPPDLAKDLDISSDEILSVSYKPIRSTRSNSAKNSIRQPTIEISSSDEDLTDEYRSPTTKVGRSSVHNNKKSLQEENDSVNSKLNLSTPKRHKSHSTKQKSIQLPKKKIEMSSENNDDDPFRFDSTKRKSIQLPKKKIEMSSEDNDDDPFGFEKAERKVRKRTIRNQFSSGNPEKFGVNTIDGDSQYNDDVQSETTKFISLNKETNKHDNNGSSAFSEIDKQDRTQSKQEKKESNTLSDNENNGDNYQVDDSRSQPTHENDKRSAESLGLFPIKTTPRDKNKKVEKKNTTPSKLKITKTADLIFHLPLRRHQQERASKEKNNKYSDSVFDDEEDDDERLSSDYEEILPKKRKVKNEKSGKKSRRNFKKETPSLESKELDEVLKLIFFLKN
jgi:hypothetical protein